MQSASGEFADQQVDQVWRGTPLGTCLVAEPVQQLAAGPSTAGFRGRMAVGIARILLGLGWLSALAWIATNGTYEVEAGYHISTQPIWLALLIWCNALLVLGLWGIAGRWVWLVRGMAIATALAVGVCVPADLWAMYSQWPCALSVVVFMIALAADGGRLVYPPLRNQTPSDRKYRVRPTILHLVLLTTLASVLVAMSRTLSFELDGWRAYHLPSACIVLFLASVNLIALSNVRILSKLGLGFCVCLPFTWVLIRPLEGSFASNMALLAELMVHVGFTLLVAFGFVLGGVSVDLSNSSLVGDYHRFEDSNQEMKR